MLLKKNFNKFRHRIFIEQILKQGLQFVFKDNKSLYKNDFIHFCHKKHKCDKFH